VNRSSFLVVKYGGGGEVDSHATSNPAISDKKTENQIKMSLSLS